MLHLAALWAFLWPGWDAVWPNIVASIIWATPAFVIQHVMTRRAIARHVDELRDHIDHHTATQGDVVGVVVDTLLGHVTRRPRPGPKDSDGA